MNSIRTTSYRYTTSQTIISALSALVLVCLCLYGVMVFVLVHRVALREKTERIISEKTIRLSQLESDYLASKHTIESNDVSTYGFVEVTEKQYVKNRSLGLSKRSIE